MSNWRVVISHKLRENEAKVLRANYCPRVWMEKLNKTIPGIKIRPSSSIEPCAS
jgi:hypothetical protein